MKLSALCALESDVQEDIEYVLQLAGFQTLHTSAFRQKGPSGVSKGVPDLLVFHDKVPNVFIGLEVKRPGKIKWSSEEQKAMAEAHRFWVAQSAVDGLTKVYATFSCLCADPLAIDKARRVLASLVDQG